MTYYLISNYTTIGEFTYNPKDILIHFNYPKNLYRFKNHKRNILVGRSPIFWKKINLYNEYSPHFRKIYADQKHNKNLISISDTKYRIFNIEDLEAQIEYPKDYIPSSGFTIYNFLKRYDRDIILVGFTSQGWEGHNWEYEHQFYIDNKVQMI